MEQTRIESFEVTQNIRGTTKSEKPSMSETISEGIYDFAESFYEKFDSILTKSWPFIIAMAVLYFVGHALFAVITSLVGV
ncbi:MAG: hypothetical protein K9L17_14140 [Clostridiales bacterium]|nr:hypothetical protein [Clostridiales bacterium]